MHEATCIALLLLLAISVCTWVHILCNYGDQSQAKQPFSIANSCVAMYSFIHTENLQLPLALSAEMICINNMRLPPYS